MQELFCELVKHGILLPSRILQLSMTIKRVTFLKNQASKYNYFLKNKVNVGMGNISPIQRMQKR